MKKLIAFGALGAMVVVAAKRGCAAMSDCDLPRG
jgi:hypothetical protein